ncbi:MAG: AI-2E family transporter [Myxococcaceae bacterium]|nr:AI-2E family transporter [Myxococcaceae bacterium]
METGRSAQRALLTLVLASLALVAWVMRPLAIALFLGAVFAGALDPTYRRLTRILGNRPRLAATVTVLAVVLLILAPIVGLSAFVVKEAAAGLRFIQETLRSEGMNGLIARLPDSIEGWVRNVLARVPLESAGGVSGTVQQQVSEQGEKAAAAVGAVVAATGSFVFQAVMMLIALYFFLTQKEQVLDFVDHASPLRRGQTRELLAETRRVTVAVLRSSILTAAVQAVAAIVGYLIARVPYALFFGGITFFFALIPAVGASSVCLLLAAALALTGHYVAAIFLATWGLLVVGLSDNVVKPWLIKGGVQLHGAVVFFALLGGLAAFGTIGLLLGPMAISFFVAALRIYRRDYGQGPRPGARPAEV